MSEHFKRQTKEKDERYWYPEGDNLKKIVVVLPQDWINFEAFWEGRSIVFKKMKPEKYPNQLELPIGGENEPT